MLCLSRISLSPLPLSVWTSCMDSPLFFLPLLGTIFSSQRLYNPSRVKSFGSVERGRPKRDGNCLDPHLHTGIKSAFRGIASSPGTSNGIFGFRGHNPSKLFFVPPSEVPLHSHHRGGHKPQEPVNVASFAFRVGAIQLREVWLFSFIA